MCCRHTACCVRESSRNDDVFVYSCHALGNNHRAPHAAPVGRTSYHDGKYDPQFGTKDGGYNPPQIVPCVL